MGETDGHADISAGIISSIPPSSGIPYISTHFLLTGERPPPEEEAYVDAVGLPSDVVFSEAETAMFDQMKVAFKEAKARMDSIGKQPNVLPDGHCRWCDLKVDHPRSRCPAGDVMPMLPLPSDSKFMRRPRPCRFPDAKEYAKRNAIVINNLPEDVTRPDVRRLVEPFGPLRGSSNRCYLTCTATVFFENIDDAERALKKLKEDGYHVEWYRD